MPQERKQGLNEKNTTESSFKLAYFYISTLIYFIFPTNSNITRYLCLGPHHLCTWGRTSLPIWNHWSKTIIKSSRHMGSQTAFYSKDTTNNVARWRCSSYNLQYILCSSFFTQIKSLQLTREGLAMKNLTIDLKYHVLNFIFHILSVYHLNGIFGSFFLDKWNALFSTKETKQIEPYHLIGIFSCQWAGVWVHIMSTRNMVAVLPVVLDVLSDGLENCGFFMEKATISSLGYCSIHISSEKPAISIHIFFLDLAQTEARRNPESYN